MDGMFFWVTEFQTFNDTDDLCKSSALLEEGHRDGVFTTRSLDKAVDRVGPATPSLLLTDPVYSVKYPNLSRLQNSGLSVEIIGSMWL